jgi:hypothetical protein
VFIDGQTDSVDLIVTPWDSKHTRKSVWISSKPDNQCIVDLEYTVFVKNDFIIVRIVGSKLSFWCRNGMEIIYINKEILVRNYYATKISLRVYRALSRQLYRRNSCVFNISTTLSF